MKRSYRYRLKPNRQQARTLSRILEAHRLLYNAALQERREAWRMCRVSVTYCMQANQLKELRSFDEDVAFLNYSSCQQTLRRLDKAFRAFFRRLKEGEEPGYPRFKGRRRFKSVAYVYGDGIRLKDGRLYIQNVGRVRIRLHRPLPEGATIKQVVIKRTGTGEWYATFQIELLTCRLSDTRVRQWGSTWGWSTSPPSRRANSFPTRAGSERTRRLWPGSSARDPAVAGLPPLPRVDPADHPLPREDCSATTGLPAQAQPAAHWRVRPDRC